MGTFKRNKLTKFFTISFLTLSFIFQPGSATAIMHDPKGMEDLIESAVVTSATATICISSSLFNRSTAYAHEYYNEEFYIEPQRAPVYLQRRSVNYHNYP